MEKFQSKKLDHEKVLRDPVHNYIHVKDQVILDIINSKEFQRLRRIKQLGPAIENGELSLPLLLVTLNG